MSKTKIRWGDTLDDEDALPPTTIKGPDSHGVKTITEYYRNEKGDSIKKVTKLKVVNVEKKVYAVRGAACGPAAGSAEGGSAPCQCIQHRNQHPQRAEHMCHAPASRRSPRSGGSGSGLEQP